MNLTLLNQYVSLYPYVTLQTYNTAPNTPPKILLNHQPCHLKPRSTYETYPI